jgi:hypothetical protein
MEQVPNTQEVMRLPKLRALVLVVNLLLASRQAPQLLQIS